MSLIDKMLARSGKTRADVRKNSRLGQVFRKRGVPESAELERILLLPRRRWQDNALDVDAFTEYLKTPEGTQELRTVQCAALCEIHDFGGMLGPIRVGGGKTLISYLAGRVLESEFVLLLVPAKLRDKTHRDFKELAKHWQGPKAIYVMSYELLSRDRGVAELEKFKPDLIIADEAHKLKNLRAACTRRLRRYMKANPDTSYVDMSGTTTKRSIMEYHHRQQWALPYELQPLPKLQNEAREWADAIDEKVDIRMAPGALFKMCDDVELREYAKDARPSTAMRLARQAYQRRLMETPGVIGTEEMHDDSMSITLEVHIHEDETMAPAFEHLRNFWETPDGHECASPADVWRHARELGLGFYYQWDPPAPMDWMEARRNWARFVRETLKYSRTLDTELMVARAHPQCAELANWQAIRDSFKPNSVPVWESKSAILAASDWLGADTGICWVGPVAAGARLDAVVPYYGAQGKDSRGRIIEDERGPCVASIAANCEGRNLQHFHRNLVLSPPASGATWEQLIGRTHRDGQKADEVTIDVLVTCIEDFHALQQSIADAEYIERTTGQAQKLLYADIIGMPEEGDLPRGPAWVKTTKESAPAVLVRA